MADPQQLDLIRKGAKAWNRWRNENPQFMTDLSLANLRNVDLSAANLQYTDLHMADLRAASLGWANLREANLSEAKVSGAQLSGADLRGAKLGGADLSRAQLSGADLRGAKLGGANLSGADLSEAKLIAAKLGGADLRAASLGWANLREADLSGANLSGAQLSGVDLHGANLNGANLSEAKLRETIFGDTELRDVQGLDACEHYGPSILDHRTLAKSGRLPLAFLRGCGLPDKLIDYLPSLLNEALQFYSCFISYSTKDQDFADRLYADLQAKGVRCWFAPHDAQRGRKLHEQIDEAIRLHEKLLLILSPNSMNSEWVKTEIARARKREVREKTQILFPVSLVPYETIRDWECFDADTGKDSAREIREYLIADFSQWKDHNSYSKGLELLIRDLQPKRGAAAG